MRFPVAAVLSVFGLAACGTVSNSGDAMQGQHSAVLFVERQATDVANARANIGARFVEFTGLDAHALPDLLGTPQVPTGLSSCRERGETAVDTSGTRAQAQLLNVGTLEVRSGDRVLALVPRPFPDLWNVVSGVIYSADDEELPSGALRFSAPGNAQTGMGAFDVEARAPEELAEVTVADQALAPGGSLTLPARAFSVRWARGERDDSVVVSFEGNGAERPTTVLCAARDEGGLEVDAAWAERVAALARGGASVTVHRIRARAFTVSQMDNAQVVFDLSVRGSARPE